MANYNIQMQYYNGGGYDILYPNIPLSSVSDWNSNIYSKSEVDSTINSINTKISNIQSFVNIGNWSILISNKTVAQNEINDATTTQVLGQNWLSPYQDAIIYIHSGSWSYHTLASDSATHYYSISVGDLTILQVKSSGNDSKSGTITPKWGVIVGTGVAGAEGNGYSIGSTLGATRMFDDSVSSVNYPLSKALKVVGLPPGINNMYMSFSVTFSVYIRTNPLFYGFTQAGVSLT